MGRSDRPHGDSHGGVGKRQTARQSAKITM